MVTRKRIDNSFIYLKPTLSEVYAEISNPQISTIKEYNYISLSPFETYRQTSNVDFDINLGQDYDVNLVDCSGNVIMNVTDRVFILEYQHSETGKTNIYYEMINLPEMYGKTVHLRFTAPILSSKTAFYSNPFTITNDPKNTSRLDYWAYGVFDGFDFGTSGAKLSIRVKAHFRRPNPTGEQQVYNRVSVPQGSVNTSIYNIGERVMPLQYLTEYITTQGLYAFESFKRMPVKYVNGVRCSGVTVNYGDVLGTSNFYTATWEASVDRTEVYIDETQIYEPFYLSAFSPTGSYTLSSFPTTLTGTFSNPITLGVGVLTIYNSLDVVVATYNQTDITVIGSTFSINISGDITVEADYYVNFESGLFVSVFNQNIFLESKTEWTFGVYTGEFENTEFSNEFLLN